MVIVIHSHLLEHVTTMIVGLWKPYNTLVNRNILRGERNLWNEGVQKYPAMEKVTLSGMLQTKLRLLTITQGRD